MMTLAASSAPSNVPTDPLPHTRPDHYSTSEERYALALASINENVYDWNVQEGTIYLSPQLLAMQGLQPDVSLEDWASRIHPEDRAYHRRMLVALFKGDTSRLEIEFRYL